MTPDDFDFGNGIDDLRSGLRAGPCEPPPESLAALHATVTARFHRRPGRRSWHFRAVVAGAVFGLVAGGSAGAYALAGGVMPRPVRIALHAIGLPVDSVPLADAKSAESRLLWALHRHDGQLVAADARALEGKLDDLSASDRRELGSQPVSLLQQAGFGGTSEVGTGETSSGGGGGATPSGDGDGSGQSSGSATTVAESGASGDGGGGGGSGEPSSPATTETTVRTGSDGSDGSATTTTVPSTSGDGGSSSPTTTTMPDGDSGGGGTAGGGTGTDGG